ncbi:Podocin [Merluccius polli]|uniref:Podocin n=1 Tax=Merluccius polli TaxID=89951 RepID=A0AA47NA15_MERPO|nr:Podocin [Merluccius polli]
MNTHTHTCAQVVTRDLVRVEVSVVCLFRIENVLLSISSLASPPELIQVLVQGALRDVLARHHFHHFLLNRKQVAREVQVAADSVAGRWGIRVERADVEEVSIPEELQQDMREQRDVQRQAQIKVTAAEGERAACQALRESLDSLSGSPAAVQLRLLQLLLTLQRSERPPLLLTLPSDILTMTHDLSHLPPPSPPSLLSVAEEEGEETDSPMIIHVLLKLFVHNQLAGAGGVKTSDLSKGGVLRVLVLVWYHEDQQVHHPANQGDVERGDLEKTSSRLCQSQRAFSSFNQSDACITSDWPMAVLSLLAQDSIRPTRDMLVVELGYHPTQLPHGLLASGGLSVWAGMSPEDVEGHLAPGVLQTRQVPQGFLAGEELVPAVALTLHLSESTTWTPTRHITNQTIITLVICKVEALGDASLDGLDVFTMSMVSIPQTLHETRELLLPAVTQLYDDVHLLRVLSVLGGLVQGFRQVLLGSLGLLGYHLIVSPDLRQFPVERRQPGYTVHEVSEVCLYVALGSVYHTRFSVVLT